MWHSFVLLKWNSTFRLLTAAFCSLTAIFCRDASGYESGERVALLGTNPQVTASLVPSSERQGLKLWQKVRIVTPSAATVPPKLTYNVSTLNGHLSYIVEGAQARLDVNSMTEDVELSLATQQAPQAEMERRARNSLSAEKWREFASRYLKQLHPDPNTFNVTTVSIEHGVNSLLQPDGSIKEFEINPDRVTIFFEQYASNSTRMLNRCWMELRRDTGQLIRYNAFIYRAQQISPLPAYSRSQALAIVRWVLSEGKSANFDIKLYSDYTEEQRRVDQRNYDIYKDEPELIVKEDAWLHQRLMWNLNTNFGAVYMDANTGEFLGYQGEYIGNKTPSGSVPVKARMESDKLFALSKPVAYPKPSKLPAVTTPVEVVTLNFNSAELNGTDVLHYPPIILSNAALIYSAYFPKFLIDVKQDGESITLQGKLKAKGKAATLKMGSTEATVDGKPVILSAAPTRIDGRLYLPAELLQQCNGVLVRWEPKKKLLWVDTRYLRRDE